jgi:hypothetical protein
MFFFKFIKRADRDNYEVKFTHKKRTEFGRGGEGRGSV